MNCLIFALLLLAQSWVGGGFERVVSNCWAVLSAHSKGVDQAPVRVASLRILAGQPTESETRGVWVPPATEGFPSADLPPADLDGNSKGDSRWAYEWDGENRLIKVTSRATAVSAGAPYQMLTFRYDALGRLLERKEYGGSAAALVLSNTTTYLYGGWKNLCTWKAVGAGASTLQASQVWGLSELGGGIEGLLFYKSAANGAHACAYDGGGNLTGLVALSNGTVSGQYEYDAFGTLLRQGGVSAVEAENPWRFSTKRMDPVSGLMHYEYRAYNPALGRWLSRDPLGEEGGENLYEYSKNNPNDEVDPLGLDPSCRPYDYQNRILTEIVFNPISGSINASSGYALNPDITPLKLAGVAGQYVGAAVLALIPEPTMLTKAGTAILLADASDHLQSILRRDKTCYQKAVEAIGGEGYDPSSALAWKNWGTLPLVLATGLPGSVRSIPLSSLPSELVSLVRGSGSGASTSSRPLMPSQAAEEGGVIGDFGSQPCTARTAVPVPKDLPKTLSPAQSRHVPGPHLGRRSPVTSDAQKLLDGIHSGEYPIFRLNPKGYPVVDFGEEVGTHVGRSGDFPTEYGTVHYGGDGAHIVPAAPIQY